MGQIFMLTFVKLEKHFSFFDFPTVSGICLTENTEIGSVQIIPFVFILLSPFQLGFSKNVLLVVSEFIYMISLLSFFMKEKTSDALPWHFPKVIELNCLLKTWDLHLLCCFEQLHQRLSWMNETKYFIVESISQLSNWFR